jgi:hypothetical protein
VYPTLHVQLVIARQPLHKAPEFAGQDVHAAEVAAAVVLEKVATGQSAHTVCGKVNK